MCGIVGYTGSKPAVRILIDGLHSLEYRGYDSAGVALAKKDSLWVARNAGMVADLEEVLNANTTDGVIAGIGHTRWATCGAPSEMNAHPHVDCSQRVALVHNGIIENHVALRKEMAEAGHKFGSETDTEVIVHLVEQAFKDGAKSLVEAMRTSLARLEGSYAVLAVSADDPSVMVASRVDAPLILGVGESENFVASDVVALLEHTRKIIALREGDIAKVSPNDIVIVDAEGKHVEPDYMQVTWDVEAAEKAGYEHFMLKEIHEQPHAIRETIRGRYSKGHGIALDEMNMSDDDVRNIDKVFVVACGSSYHAGLVAKYAIEHWTRIPVEIDVASEFRYRDPVLDSRTMVVGISQSGETADTLAAVRYAKKQDAKVVTITNVVGSSITRESDAILYTHAGPEIGVAATKTLTTQMSALWLLALWAAQIRGTMFPDEIQEMMGHLVKLPDQIEQIVSDDTGIRKLAEGLADSKTFLFIGRGVGFPVALEGALKLKELSYLHAEGFAAGEMKHGPIALLEEGVPVIAVASQSHVHAKLISNIEESKARGAHVIAICNIGDKETASIVDEVIEVPTTLQLLSPALDVVPLQLFAYYVAAKLGMNPDKPRNLAKSVTVE